MKRYIVIAGIHISTYQVTMTYHNLINSLIYLHTISQVILADEVSVCDKSKCKGPIAYYEDLKCTPIYGENSCCPVKYNCDILDRRSRDKCYYQGRVYAIEERVRDLSPCSPCTCVVGDLGNAEFICAIIDCIRPPPDCYFKTSFTECCGGEEVCPRNGTEVAKCEVNGNTYFAGQPFVPESDPTKSCICDEGYTGENEAPFCKTQNYATCNVELYHSNDIYNDCAPLFYNNMNPATDCAFAFRCPNTNDIVLPSDEVSCVSDPSDFCKFGNLTLRIGDELGERTIDEYVCVKCVCGVPPLPTCQRLPESECHVTVST